MTNNVALLSQLKKSLVTIATAAIALLGCDVNQQNSLTKQSVIYCSEGSPESFNPQTVTSGTTIDATSNQLYNRLITIDSEDNSLKPSLAKSWHVTRDGKMFTFYLRKNVAFHQTSYFTPTRFLNADDVIFTFNRILNTEHEFHNVGAGKYPYFQNVGFNELVDKVERINDYTIRFSLKRSDSSFLAHLATHYAVILSKEYGDQLAENFSHSQIDSRPIGTGPFKFYEFRVGSLIRYYKHMDYWQGPASVEQLVYDITTSNTGRLTKLLTEECDVISYPIAHEKIIQHPFFELEEVTSLNIAFLAFNTRKAPFDNPNVRKAIGHAINKQAIINAVYFGQAVPAKSVVPSVSWAYDENTPEIEYSIDKARVLLEEAGINEPINIDIWAMPVQRAYNPDALTMAKLIQGDLQKIGINVNIITYEWATFLRKLVAGEHHSVLIGWSADHPDPDNFFTPLLSCAAAETGSNRAFWCDQLFDDIIADALKVTDIKQRKVFYAEAMQMISEQVPLIPIAHSKRFQARHRDVQGEILDTFGVNFTKVSK